jgi:hypothetical protein
MMYPFHSILLYFHKKNFLFSIYLWFSKFNGSEVLPYEVRTLMGLGVSQCHTLRGCRTPTLIITLNCVISQIIIGVDVIVYVSCLCLCFIGLLPLALIINEKTYFQLQAY